MLNFKFDYRSCLDASERVNWRVDELLPASAKLQFERAHLPESLSGTAPLTFLGQDDKLKLNQIRGNSYMNIFGFVEEYIIAQTVQHAEAEMFGDHEAIRALLKFGEEEVKHQTLFKRYCASFERDFGSQCGVLGQAVDVARIILSKSPIAVMLTTLHIELMTQHHYTSAIKDNTQLDPLFTKILKSHWLEESQHARIDMLELDKMCDAADQKVRDAGYDDYFAIMSAFDGLLKQQVEMDLESLKRVTDQKLSGPQRDTMRAAQLSSYRDIFIRMGMNNPTFADIAGKLSPSGAQKLIGQLALYA